MQNQLDSESSPYLIQHKSNPVHWRPWGPAAFEEAKSKNLPIFLSIGYSTCHWCHVMAHESFEDQEVADQLNADYISIKVDREERPDVDEFYMKACQALTGGGGWPLSAWLTFEGKPFFAGTYFQKYRFQQLLRRVSDVWKNQPENIHKDADQLLKAISASPGEESLESVPPAEQVKNFLQAYQHSFDEQNGGFGHQPKFPPAMGLKALLRFDQLTGLNQSEAMVESTLTHMARGGIYDHLVGGFHRYSVDSEWLVPHFEKMLYDQAMLLGAYTEGYQVTKNHEFKTVAEQIASYVQKDLRNEEGCYYSAEDADSLNPETGHSEEGYFATFAYSELLSRFSSDEMNWLKKNFGVSEFGHLDERNIIHLDPASERISDPLESEIRKKLLLLRSEKPKPHLDDKSLLSWNAWMSAALIRSSFALGRPEYLEWAKQNISFWANAYRSKKWARSYRQGRWSGPITAEDLSAFVHALIELSQADEDPRWPELAIELQAKLDEEFWIEAESAYSISDGKDPFLPSRLADAYDGVTPSVNSQCAYNLYRLYLLTGIEAHLKRYESITRRFGEQLQNHPSSLPYMAMAVMLEQSVKTRVVVFEGEEWVRGWVKARRAEFHPGVLWVSAQSSWALVQGKGLRQNQNPSGWIQVCTANSCQEPITNEQKANQDWIN